MEIRYRDDLVQITDDDILFRRYAYPGGADKRVPLAHITRIRVLRPTFWSGKWRLWGTGDLRTWFPQDRHRPQRDRIFVAELRGRWRRIGFTVEDSAAVLHLLRERGLVSDAPAGA